MCLPEPDQPNRETPSAEINCLKDESNARNMPLWRLFARFLWNSIAFVLAWAVLWALVLAFCATRSPETFWTSFGGSWTELIRFYVFSYSVGVLAIPLFEFAEKIESKDRKNAVIAFGILLIAVILSLAVSFLNLV